MKFYLWIVAFGVLTSCVDDKYDLGKIDTDGILVGDEWVLPLGTVDVKVTDVIELDQNKVEGLEIAENGNYSVSYVDEIQIPFPDIPELPSIPGLPVDPAPIDIASIIPTTTFTVGDLSNIMGDFGKDFVLGLANPYVTLQAIGLEGSGVVDATLRLTASKLGTDDITLDAPFKISAAKPNVWIGPKNPNNSSYTFVQKEDLPELVAAFPEKMVLKATQFLVPVNEVTDIKGLKYELKLPFIPSEKFRATAIQSMNDIFDESMVDYLFTSGSTTISGTVKNTLPFNATIVMSITDAAGKELITLPAQQLVGESSPVSFEITEKDMPKMKNARNIQLKFVLSGRPQSDAAILDNGYLNANQTMKMELKLRKKGGIKVEA